MSADAHAEVERSAVSSNVLLNGRMHNPASPPSP
jgi:hypothetical protein